MFIVQVCNTIDRRLSPVGETARSPGRLKNVLICVVNYKIKLLD